MCVVFCFCFGQDAVLVHCCARHAAELHAGVCFSSFINNFVTQLCFSTTSHNYGNLKSHWETRGSRGGTWLFLSISLRQIRTFDHTKAVCLPSQWSLSSPSIKKEREKKKEKLTICPQADADHISPPTSCLWCRRCVRSGAGQSRRRLSYHSLFHLYSPWRLFLSHLGCCESSFPHHSPTHQRCFFLYISAPPLVKADSLLFLFVCFFQKSVCIQRKTNTQRAIKEKYR